jgi:hypothetical protein
MFIATTQAQSTTYKYLHGKVYNKTSGLGIAGVKIRIGDSSYGIQSKNTGAYVLRTRKESDSILFEHPGYQPLKLALKKSTRSMDAPLCRLQADSNDLPGLKNTLSFLPLKLITGGLSLNYERFIKTKLSTGLNATYYFKGRQYFGNEEFTGLKLTPHVRFYFKRNKSYGFYIQGGIIVAYFDFSKLNYNYSNDLTRSVSKYFWAGGVGSAIGIMDILGKSSNAIVDINIGLQNFPSPIEPKWIDEHGREYSHNTAWWLLGGPGSIIEIKIAIGGIF